MAEVNLLDPYPRSKRPIEERGKLVSEEHRKVTRYETFTDKVFHT